jgi:hypothetical protein
MSALIALMLSKTYEAFLVAGAPEDKAREAAEAIAVYENRFVRIETDVAVIRADLSSVKWMLGVCNSRCRVGDRRRSVAGAQSLCLTPGQPAVFVR